MANEYQSELDRINQNIADTYSVLSGMGAPTPAEANSDNLAETAASIKVVKSMTYDSGSNKWTLTYTDGTTSTVDGPAIPDVSAYMPKSGGAFTGAVQVGTASTGGYYARNIKFSETAETPTTEGDICFKLK